MKIGIDANLAIYNNAGIGRYTFNLVKYILKADKNNQYTIYFNHLRTTKEKQIKISAMIGDAKNVKIQISKVPDEWKNKILNISVPANYLYSSNLDILHEPHFTSVPKNLSSIKNLITTIHDVAFLHYPSHNGSRNSQVYNLQTKRAIEKSKMIIADSESTKRDLEKFYNIKPENVRVVHLAAEEKFRVLPDEKIRAKKLNMIAGDSQFILSVCTLEPRKNLTLLLKAYANLPQDFKKTYKLVLIGGNGWNNEEFYKTIQELNLENYIILTGHVSDEDLVYYYNRASLFVYPSLYEGFGIPLLEAMSCGSPVISSNVSSMPEIVGKAGVLLSPHDEKAWIKAMREVATNRKLAQRLRQLGLQQVKKFSWEKTAKKTLEVYKEVYDNSN